jgi:hypothetical protein
VTQKLVEQFPCLIQPAISGKVYPQKQAWSMIHSAYDLRDDDVMHAASEAKRPAHDGDSVSSVRVAELSVAVNGALGGGGG